MCFAKKWNQKTLRFWMKASSAFFFLHLKLFKARLQPIFFFFFGAKYKNFVCYVLFYNLTSKIANPRYISIPWNWESPFLEKKYQFRSRNCRFVRLLFHFFGIQKLIFGFLGIYFEKSKITLISEFFMM